MQFGTPSEPCISKVSANVAGTLYFRSCLLTAIQPMAVFIEVWIISSDGQRISRPASGHWMDPVFIQSVPDPVLAHEVNNNAADCAPGESLAGTLFAETRRFGTNNRNKVHWREIKSMMDDPFIEQGRDKRMKQLYGLGIGIVATVPFRCQRTDGIVLFMSRTTVDTDMLISEKNEKYLLGAVDLIRASISIQEARDERSWMKQSTRQVAIDKLKSSLLKPSGRSNFAKSIRTSSQMRISQPSISYQERRQSIQEVVSMSEAGKEQRGRVLALTTELTRSLKNSIRKWRGGGLKAPPRQDLEESLIAWVGVFSTMLALTCFDHPYDPRSVYDAAWFSSTLCIVFSLTAAPVGQPIQIVLSHLWNSLVGLAFRYAPLPMLVKQSMSTAFGVSGMAILGIMHPPSTSLAYTFASKSDIDYISLVWVLICGEF